MDAREQRSSVEQKIQPLERQVKTVKKQRKVKLPTNREDDSNGRVQSSSYYWTDRENRSYLKFLKEKGKLLTLDAVKRKKEKTNLKLSKYVQTRTPTQCHTHHQKMMIKYGSVERTILYLNCKFGLRTVQRKKKAKNLLTTVSVENEMRLSNSRGICEQKVEHQGTSILKEQNDLDYIYY